MQSKTLLLALLGVCFQILTVPNGGVAADNSKLCILTSPTYTRDRYFLELWGEKKCALRILTQELKKGRAGI